MTRTRFHQGLDELKQKLLAMGGIMALTVWVETFCRQRGGADWRPARAWRDSRSMALFVFSMCAVAEILLDRMSRVGAQ